MNNAFIFLLMIFCHIIDDYKLQAGVLNSLKQKQYWKENAPDKLYEYDYIWGLLMHSSSWSFMIMLPIAYTMSFSVNELFVFVFILNMIMHAVVDDLKANRKRLNLIQDQIIHMLQIVATAMLFLG